MSIPVLIQVYDEMRRLAIAGSAVAAGDFRLKKLVPPLEKSGEKAPVFSKVAQAIQAVVDSNEKTASLALLELATLVNAILYTQGETGIAGDLKPLESKDLGGQATQASARVLKPLLEALTTTGSGRLELIRDAQESGTFKDLRLVRPALNALDDPYPEVADLIAEKVLPLYGKAIVPELRAKLNVKGRAGHLHRLQLMHRLDPQGSRDLIQLALSDGSKEMKVAAVECLGTTDADLVYLLEQTKAKAKDAPRRRCGALAAAGQQRGRRRHDIEEGDRRRRPGVDHRPRETEYACGNSGICAGPGGSAVYGSVEMQGQDPARAADRRGLQQLVHASMRRTDAKAETFLLKCFENARRRLPRSNRSLRERISTNWSLTCFRKPRQRCSSN